MPALRRFLFFNVKLLTHGEKESFKGVAIEAFGKDHAIIYEKIGFTDNTGYLIAGKFFHPGDFLFVPLVEVEILALPIEAPWLKLSECIEYLSKVNPKTCFSVHDARLSEIGLNSNVRLISTALPNVQVIVLEKGKTYEF